MTAKGRKLIHVGQWHKFSINQHGEGGANDYVTTSPSRYKSSIELLCILIHKYIYINCVIECSAYEQCKGFFSSISNYYTIVNINSKYKEDDCTDSNASVNSLDVCVHRIHFRNEASTPHMSNPRSSQLPPHLSSQPKTPEMITTQSQRATLAPTCC